MCGVSTAGALKSLAVARAGTTVALGLVASTPQPPTGAPGGIPTLPQASDFQVFDRTKGVYFNGTPSPAPKGKDVVAASANGRTVAAAGPATTSGHELSLWTVRGPAEGPPTGNGAQVPDWAQALPGPAVSLALSATGDRLAVATKSATESHVMFYEGRDRVLDATSPEIAGRVNAMALAEDAKSLVAGGAFTQGTDSYGAVYRFSLSPISGTPWRYVIPNATSANEVISVRVAPDGSTFAALTSAGNVLVFASGAPQPRLLANVPTGIADAKGFALAADASTFVVGGGQTIVSYTKSGATWTRAWNATLSGSVTTLDLDDAGAIALAATTAGASAYGARKGVELWTVSGPTDGAALVANATAAVLVQGRLLCAYVMPVKMSLAAVSAEVPKVRPFEPKTVQVRLTNNGSAPLTADVLPPASRDVVFSVAPSRVEILPGESALANVTFTPSRLSPERNPYAFTVVARNVYGKEQANATLSFAILPQGNLDVQLLGAIERRIGQNASDDIQLTLQNDGNAPLPVSVAVLQSPSRGADWRVELVGDANFALPAGGVSSTRFIVKTPERVLNGTVNELTITVRSANFSRTHEVVYRVNPIVNVNLTALGRAKVLAPGDHSQFNLTVTNTGTITSSFMVTYDAAASSDRTWVVDVDSTPFPLAPGESHVVPVRVFAPRAGDIGDRVFIRVQAVSLPGSDGDGIAKSNLTLVANVQPRVLATTPETTRPGPLPGPVALLAVVGAVALVLASRRRRSS